MVRAADAKIFHLQPSRCVGGMNVQPSLVQSLAVTIQSNGFPRWGLNKQRVGISKHLQIASPPTGVGLAITSGEEHTATSPDQDPLKSDKFSYPHPWKL